MSPEYRAYHHFSYQELRRFEIPQKKKLVQYDLDFDTRKYKLLRELRITAPQFYEEEKAKLDAYTRCNLRTALGERFNVLLSSKRNAVVDGRIIDPDSGECLYDMFVRGMEYRRDNGSTDEDQKRETAEVASFKDIEHMLTDTHTPLGTMIVLFSPPGKEGTEYRHNFYDIYTLSGANNDRFIDYRRYSSALSREESFVKVKYLDPFFASDKEEGFLPDDVYFLSHPVTLLPQTTPFKTPEEIHRYLHAEHGYMLKEKFDAILDGCESIENAYLVALSEQPDNIRLRNLIYNAYLNKADSLADQTAREGAEKAIIAERLGHTLPTREELLYFGLRPVRSMVTGCGLSGGTSLDEIVEDQALQDVVRSPFSVLDFALNEDITYSFDKEGKCVVCGRNGSLGPCNICRGCDGALRRKNGKRRKL